MNIVNTYQQGERIVNVTDVVCLTGEKWLFDQFDGFSNINGTALIHPIFDPDGDPIIGKHVLDDPDWDFMGQIEATNPNTQESKSVENWLSEKVFKYFEPEPDEL